MDGAALQRLAILENRMKLAELKADDIESRLLTVEQSTRFAAMERQKSAAPSFGDVEYRIWPVGCFRTGLTVTDRAIGAGVRIVGSLWSNIPSGTLASVGDNFDITTNASNYATFFGRSTWAGLSNIVGQTDGTSSTTTRYRAQLYAPAGQGWWKPISSLIDLYVLVIVIGDPFPAPSFVYPSMQANDTLWLCISNRGPYPAKNPFTIRSTNFAPDLITTGTSTATVRLTGTTWQWNGFAWMGVIGGQYDVTYSLLNNIPQFTAQTLAVTSGGTTRPVDVGSLPGGTGIFTAATGTLVATSSTGTGNVANWSGSWTYTTTGTAFGNATGIATETVTSA